MIFLPFLFIYQAQAGWMSDFCQKHLIAADPYQFEEASIAWLRIEHYRLFCRIRNRIATRQDRELFEIINLELKQRDENEI